MRNENPHRTSAIITFVTTIDCFFIIFIFSVDCARLRVERRVVRAVEVTEILFFCYSHFRAYVTKTFGWIRFAAEENR